MNKKEYEEITKFLDDGQIEELRKYLDERMNSKYINGVRKALNDLINNDCNKDYPSYYAKTTFHAGVLKIYRGFYGETDKGFIILHKRSNAFELYDKSVLTDNIAQALERSCVYSDERKRKGEELSNLLSNLANKDLTPIYSFNQDENNTKVWSADGEASMVVPTMYYKIAHKLLGEQAKEYMIQEANGVYFDSPNGRALVLKKKMEDL